MHRHTAPSHGWNPFWAALGAALLVLLPLVGGTVLLTRKAVRERLPAAESQRGVPVHLPAEADRMTLLVCLTGENPGFLLLHLDAFQNRLGLLALPAETCVDFGGKDATLAHCYASAGPARCREALTPLLALPEDTRYLALSPALLSRLAGRYGSFRVGFSGALTPEELTLCGMGNGVQGLSADEAHRVLSELEQEYAASLPPFRRAAARAVVWDAFFRQNLELLPAALPESLRTNSSSLLTDLTAQDYTHLEEILEFLANGSAPVWAEALPGSWDGSLYRPDDASRAAVQTLFNVSPTNGQASSANEP